MTRPAGRFISLEGGEGAGKSTQARLLADTLRQSGLEVLLTREPGGTPGAEAIRQMLLAPPAPGWTAAAEALLFAAARADHVARTIIPALARGAWVVCDRFLDSSRAYQGGEGGLDDADLLAIHRIGSHGLLPGKTLLLELGADQAGERLHARDGGSSDAIGGRDAGYHAGVAIRFAELAVADPDRFIRIDATGSPAAVHHRILTAIGAPHPC
ncbi:thymidylate kinase [Croceibacterium mercuriale]|uniref:Thymidylate kinase n=1 Tax=Croceibacterium mercuriale TaxID=1572751 RepID=A0A0B2C0T5_9SPHN|nr:dTMP kinase [Croceibacterium mercuriale]KHL25897.1 thymidylate kinase [Croceibacterium mercuriale]